MTYLLGGYLCPVIFVCTRCGLGSLPRTHAGARGSAKQCVFVLTCMRAQASNRREQNLPHWDQEEVLVDPPLNPRLNGKRR